jgi:hypothetical protein
MERYERNKSLGAIQEFQIESSSSESSSNDEEQPKRFTFNQEIPMPPIDKNPSVRDIHELDNMAIERLGLNSLYEYESDEGKQRVKELMSFIGLRKEERNIYDININTVMQAFETCITDQDFKLLVRNDLGPLWHEKRSDNVDQARAKVLSRVIECLFNKIEKQRKISQESDLQIETKSTVRQKQTEKSLTHTRKVACATGISGVGVLLYALAMTYLWFNSVAPC